jgi:protein arginine N-methyltransferase 2
MANTNHEEKVLAISLISAAARHDNVAVKNLLKSVRANVQDAETGYAPLHAAIASCDTKNDDGTEGSRPQEETVFETVRILLENGAIWNDLDKNDETPGCIAYRLGLKKVYQQIVDAGVRAELLLSKLAEIEGEADEDDDDEEEDVDMDDTEANGTSGNGEEAPATETAPLNKVEHPTTQEPPEDYIDRWDSNADYLRSSLRYTDTQLLDSSSNAIMMDWETEIMQRHAESILPKKGLRAMNIGHGMGIVDTAIQTHEPVEHHIVEAHPAVLAQMRKTGWFEKPGVHIHEGRWQDVLPKLIADGVQLDGIYYDTFAEEYNDLKDLFSEHVISLLDQSGRFSFYHGLGADRRVCYDVYTTVSCFHRPFLPSSYPQSCPAACNSHHPSDAKMIRFRVEAGAYIRR